MMVKRLTDRLNYIERNITQEQLLNVAYPIFLEETPIRTGNARRRTRKLNDQIAAIYPYAKRLDEGWSKQSPDGMVAPTINEIRAYIRRKLGN